MSPSGNNKTGGSWFPRVALSAVALAVLAIGIGAQAPAASAARTEKTAVVETEPAIKVVSDPIQTLRSASWN